MNTEEDIGSKIFRYIKAILLVSMYTGVAPENIKPEANLENDILLDDLDKIELLMSLENEYKVQIPDEVVESLKTISDVIEYIKKYLKDGK